MQSRRSRYSVILLTFLIAPPFCVPGLAQSTFTVVNGASYGAAIAPDGWATIFGTNLALVTALAELDSNGQLPTELGAIRVEINGVAAPLYFVSPSQINLVVPAGLSPGAANVIIRAVGSGATKSGTALLRTTDPGIFTLDTSGSGPGAILNAVTYQGPPFIVQTPENGADTRTRVAVYATGIRHAAVVTAAAQDPAGNRYALTVEYAGAAPGFFALDQVNLLLPPDLDGAGAVALVLTADTFNSNPVTLLMGLMPASSLRLAALALSPTVVTAGDASTLTVGLNGVARPGGFAVGLRSSNTAAQVNAQITIPPGKASAQTTVTTSSQTPILPVTITAQAGEVTQTADLTIEPVSTVRLAGLVISPASILGGRKLTATINLTGNAPANDIHIQLASDNQYVQPLPVVTMPFGVNSANFEIPTLPVPGPQTVTLTATLGRDTSTAKVTVLPVLQLTLGSDSVVGGNSVNGTVTLGDPAPLNGANITLPSSDAQVRIPPIPFTIPAGSNSQSFTLTTSQVTAARTVTITATYAGVTQTASLTLNPPAAATISSLAIVPNRVKGGSPATATVTLTGPAGIQGVRVVLETSGFTTAHANPNFVIIPQGQNSANFAIITAAFPSVVTFTATANGDSKTATLTVE